MTNECGLYVESRLSEEVYATGFEYSVHYCYSARELGIGFHTILDQTISYVPALTA